MNSKSTLIQGATMKPWDYSGLPVHFLNVKSVLKCFCKHQAEDRFFWIFYEILKKNLIKYTVLVELTEKS